MMLELVKKEQLIASVKYYLLNGWLGPAMPRHPHQSRGRVNHCLTDIQLVTTHQKVSSYFLFIYVLTLCLTNPG